MNIEKLAKHLKEFTLDEINMISECDCKIELELLLNENKIVFEQGVYKCIENCKTETYEVFTIQKGINKNISVKIAFDKFLNEYVKLNCKKSTYVRYRSVIKYICSHIVKIKRSMKSVMTILKNFTRNTNQEIFHLKLLEIICLC